MTADPDGSGADPALTPPTRRTYSAPHDETAKHLDRALIATVITCSIALAALILAQTGATNAAIADIHSDMREDRAELIAAINRNGDAIAELRAIVTGTPAGPKPPR